MKFNAEAALTRIQAVEALVSRWEFEPRVEQVSVAQACGRVLAQDCHARYDLPRHRVSRLFVFIGLWRRFSMLPSVFTR